jgi:hypothetical protein
MKPPLSRYIALAQRRTMAVMSRLEPPLLKNHMAIYPLGAAWTMADRRKAKPSLAQHDQAISWTGW